MEGPRQIGPQTVGPSWTPKKWTVGPRGGPTVQGPVDHMDPYGPYGPNQPINVQRVSQVVNT